MSERSLAGKVVLVTGGGRGLGEAICRNLHAAGARLIIADVREQLVSRLAQELADGDRRALPIVADLCEDAHLERVLRSAVEEFGRIDALVNNAGIDRTLPIEELPAADWDRVIAVNLRAPFLLSKGVLPIMKRQGSGHIVNVVSTAAKRAWANAAAYHASKWGLLGLSQALHVEARPHGIKVTAVIAGGMRTPFLLERFPEIDPAVLQDPANVAETIRFVLSLPAETVIPEIMVLPMRETSWP